MIRAVLSGAVAGYGVAVPVGAIGALIVLTGAHRGLRVGAAAAAGVAVVDALYATVAVLFGAILASRIEPLRVPLRAIAAVVLLAIGVRLVASGWRQTAADPAAVVPPTARRAFLTVVALTAVNPATLLYFTALIGGSSMSEIDRTAERLAFAGAVGVASVSWQLVLAAAGASAGSVLTGPAGRRWSAVAGGAVVTALAVKTVAGG
ncbi:LysE family transporter [Desertimonas flava]|uniref:LysE family transporter n=1 Tax=Desertimonas flava TaxID=2064846 RepID=UPI000E3500E4|nr:LysE family transporter [Desertimonas flava]